MQCAWLTGHTSTSVCIQFQRLFGDGIFKNTLRCKCTFILKIHWSSFLKRFYAKRCPGTPGLYIWVSYHVALFKEGHLSLHNLDIGMQKGHHIELVEIPPSPGQWLDIIEEIYLMERLRLTIWELQQRHWINAGENGPNNREKMDEVPSRHEKKGQKL